MGPSEAGASASMVCPVFKHLFTMRVSCQSGSMLVRLAAIELQAGVSTVMSRVESDAN